LFGSQTILAIGITFLVLVTSSSVLLFFGRKNNPKASAQISAKETVDNPVSPQTEEMKIEELKERARNSSANQRLIPKDQLEKSKRELRTLLLEKELVSGALTRLYEAEAAKEITKDEREMLALKYREELKSLDSKIVGIDAFIEVGDLETLRDQLLRLVSEKIDAIERRIERAKINVSPMMKDILDRNPQKKSEDQSKLESEKTTKPPVPNISDLITPSPTQSSSAESSQIETPLGITEPIVPISQSPRTQSKRKSATSDGQVEELQKELLEALDRLEKLDVET
jgi:hypothetical protein